MICFVRKERGCVLHLSVCLSQSARLLDKKPVHRARKTARCVIYQFPQSTLLFGTARPLPGI